MITTLINTALNVFKDLFLYISGRSAGINKERTKIQEEIIKTNDTVKNIQSEVSNVKTTTDTSKQNIIDSLNNGEFK